MTATIVGKETGSKLEGEIADDEEEEEEEEDDDVFVFDFDFEDEDGGEVFV